MSIANTCLSVCVCHFGLFCMRYWTPAKSRLNTLLYVVSFISLFPKKNRKRADCNQIWCLCSYFLSALRPLLWQRILFASVNFHSVLHIFLFSFMKYQCQAPFIFMKDRCENSMWIQSIAQKVRTMQISCILKAKWWAEWTKIHKNRVIGY